MFCACVCFSRPTLESAEMNIQEDKQTQKDLFSMLLFVI